MTEEKLLTTEEIKGIELNILEEFADFCEENGLRYFLVFGTLLGAVRHKGFIPWDDDIDVGMPREDYEILVNTYKSKSGRYRVHDRRFDKDYTYAYAKLSDEGTRLVDFRRMPYRIGVNMDIWPLDDLGNDMKKIRRRVIYMHYVTKTLDAKAYNNSFPRSIYKKIGISLTKFLLKPISFDKFISYVSNSMKVFDKYRQEYCGVFVASPCGIIEIVRKDWYSDFIMMEFEQRMYRVPVGYHELLNQKYGDYMQLPPKEKQVTHHDFDAWRTVG